MIKSKPVKKKDSDDDSNPKQNNNIKLEFGLVNVA